MTTAMAWYNFPPRQLVTLRSGIRDYMAFCTPHFYRCDRITRVADAQRTDDTATCSFATTLFCDILQQPSVVRSMTATLRFAIYDRIA